MAAAATTLHILARVRMERQAAGWLRFAIGCSLLAGAVAGRDEDGKLPEGVVEMYSSNFDMQISNVWPPAAAIASSSRRLMLLADVSRASAGHCLGGRVLRPMVPSV